ncbi:NAD(P)-binding protein [Crocinitomix catalasitica]|uniref:NAD(P)-binding protein n=1 Tax=Crocinitomix catalasitica TaxID=184607 RepID=UPI0004884D92|nr:NAD(P)-binding protein [Crocinitomix catalasitica]
MNRRGFIQISSVAALPILLGIFPRNKGKQVPYKINVRSNRSFGHLLREKANVKPTSTLSTDFIIVGGGVAGIAAATVLRDQDFLLFEGDDRLGGSSASASWKTTEFATGAHYELAYPETFGQEVIALLRELDIISFNSETALYEFNDKAYIISGDEMEQCFNGELLLSEVMEAAEGIQDFNKALKPFIGQMHLPTRLIGEEYQYLNALSFKDFLEGQFDLSADLSQRISYQMLDDWGAQIDEVSALAGIHYYTCRPYNTKDVELFSAPNGNAYFTEKMIGLLSNPEAFVTNTFVRSVRETADGVEAEVLNKNGSIQLVKAKGLIYAGQKHALKYILAQEESRFQNSYAPWLVLNIVCRKGVDFEKWQNDIITPELQFLGFINSSKQHARPSEFDVFTAYYCFKEEDRGKLVEIEKNPDEFVAGTIALIEEETGTALSDFVAYVNVNVLGHAMPIAKPGYLSFNDVPSFSDRIVYAGVDTGRLPLFFEACDSGLQAGEKILNNITKNKANEL